MEYFCTCTLSLAAAISRSVANVVTYKSKLHVSLLFLDQMRTPYIFQMQISVTFSKDQFGGKDVLVNSQEVYHFQSDSKELRRSCFQVKPNTANNVYLLLAQIRLSNTREALSFLLYHHKAASVFVCLKKLTYFASTCHVR